MSDGRRRPRRLRHDSEILLLALAAGAPGSLVALSMLWFGDHSDKVRWTLSLFIGGAWLAFAFTVRARVVRPLQTISNLVAALREGDYSIRARGADFDDALGLALAEINLLGAPLREERLGAREATALLRRIVSEIDVAIFAFDHDGRLRLANRTGERMLAQPSERLIGRDAASLGLASLLQGESRRVVEATFPGSVGRWEVRRSAFRQGGREHQLLVLSDLSRTLREEERLVWQRLVRVLSHEINNSLAPIKSLAGSLLALLGRDARPADADADLIACIWFYNYE